MNNRLKIESITNIKDKISRVKLINKQADWLDIFYLSEMIGDPVIFNESPVGIIKGSKIKFISGEIHIEYDCLLWNTIFKNNVKDNTFKLVNSEIHMFDKLDFNEENIREIAEESFLESLWDMEGFSCDCRNIVKGREKLKREEFIKTMVDGCLNGKIMHLSFDEWHRGISKSHFINKMSSEFKIPVVCKFDSHIKIHEKDCYKVYKYNNLIGIRPCKILIDEGFTFEEIRKMRNQGFEVLGFINTCGRYNLI